jgi:phage FluMu gp28-like protein
MELNLYKPHETQQKVLECQSRFIVLLCGRRWGKSLISQTITILHLLGNKQVAYITPTYHLASVFFDEIVRNLNGIAKTNRTELTIELLGGKLRFFTGEKLDLLRGHKFHMVIVDEAAYIRNLQEGWERVIRATLTDYSGKALFVSTPRGFDYLYSLSQIQNHDWQTFKFTTYDNPFIPKNEIDEAKMMLPPAVFEQEYLANPMQNADNPFGSDNIRNNIIELSNKPALYYGIDLAKSYDFSVIIGLDEDGKVAKFDRFQKSWQHTKDTILMLPRNTQGYIDSTGVGDPIVEDITTQRRGLEGFKFTSSSKQQLMEGLVSAVHQGLIKYPKGIITDEMEVFEYRFTSTGVRYSARDGFHDDTVMALALAWKAFIERRTFGKYTIMRA